MRATFGRFAQASVTRRAVSVIILKYIYFQAYVKGAYLHGTYTTKQFRSLKTRHDAAVIRYMV